MSSGYIQTVYKKLQRATQGAILPMSVVIAQKFPQNSFCILISCLLSLRAKDLITLPVSLRLFARATTPKQMLAIPVTELETIIYSVNYYKKKAAQLHEVSQVLLDRFAGQVPSTKEELLSIRGVGLKTANLVLAEGFGVPAICVDVHVHRISNRLGLVQTKTPEETEQALKKLLPQSMWIDWNRLLVMLGQTICTPQSPHCSVCPVAHMCDQVGVVKSR